MSSSGWGNQGHGVYLCCGREFHGEKHAGIHNERAHGFKRTQDNPTWKRLPYCQTSIEICMQRFALPVDRLTDFEFKMLKRVKDNRGSLSIWETDMPADRPALNRLVKKGFLTLEWQTQNYYVKVPQP